MAKCVFCGKQCRFTIIPEGGSLVDKYPAHKKCDSEFHSPSPPPQIYIEGNGGGDYLQIIQGDNGTLHLEVGHCCIHDIRAIVPVEFVTTALSKAVLDAGGIKEFIRQTGWNSDEFTESLIAKVRQDEL